MDAASDRAGSAATRSAIRDGLSHIGKIAFVNTAAAVNLVRMHPRRGGDLVKSV